MEQKTIENPLVEKWLRVKKSVATKSDYKKRIRYFLDHFKMTPEQLLEMTPQEARELCLIYQNESRHLSNNAILSRMTAVSSFLDYNDKPITWKRNTKVSPRPDVTSHVFSNGDLSRMFEVGDIQEKALLSLACSLGWEISSFTDFNREILSKLLERQKETKEPFVYFKQIREKTGQPRLGILNPSAIEWCNKWLKISENQEIQQTKMKTSDIFNLTERGIVRRVKKMAIKAGIKTTGSVKFHNIRKWVMSGLSRSGFNEWQTKFVLGKAIPLADSTYLQSLEQEVRERYPSAYENYLNLSTTISKDLKKKIEDENKKLKDKFTEMQKENAETKKEMRQLGLTVKSLVEKLEKLTEG